MKEVICQCAEDELKDTRENTIDMLDEDVETFLERYEKLKHDKEETVMRASYRDTEKDGQEPTASCSNYRLEKFTTYPELKPKFLEKEANLIVVNTWIHQMTHYIKAGYKHNPPKKGVYMHLCPLLHQI